MNSSILFRFPFMRSHRPATWLCPIMEPWNMVENVSITRKKGIKWTKRKLNTRSRPRPHTLRRPLSHLKPKEWHPFSYLEMENNNIGRPMRSLCQRNGHKANKRVANTTGCRIPTRIEVVAFFAFHFVWNINTAAELPSCLSCEHWTTERKTNQS